MESKKKGLTVNSKTTCMVVSNKKKGSRARKGGQEFNYLGSVVTENSKM